MSVIGVREFRLDDLEAAGAFCDAAREQDPWVEPFSQRLGVIATGTRAALELWRVAEDEAGALHGIVFAALRESQDDRPVFDFYCAIDPSLRRQGLGRALCAPALASGAILRARVREEAKAGRAFLAALGFAGTGAQLMLHWNGERKSSVEMPALRIRAGAARDQAIVERLSSEAWKGAPDAFASRADEIAQLFGQEGRIVLIAESDGRPMGYLTGVQLGRTLGIEEVAVLPEFRRMGIARALVAHALAKEQNAVLSVSESNRPARALYRSLGFTQTSRRLVFEKK